MDEFKGMNRDELHAGIMGELHRQLPTPPSGPLPPGITPDMKPESQETARTLFGASIMNKQASGINAEEREFLLKSINSALRDLEGR